MTVHTHGYPGYIRGCRCQTCRDAHTIAQRGFRARRAARAAEDAPHGTPGGYMNWACRCQLCVDVYRTYLADRRATRGY